MEEVQESNAVDTPETVQDEPKKRRPGRPKAERKPRKKRYINVSRAKLHTGVEYIEVNGQRVKTRGVLFPRDWVTNMKGDEPDLSQGAMVMELDDDIAAAFGDKVVAVS